MRQAASDQGLDSIRSIAAATGLSAGAVGALLRGKTDPTLGTMLALVDGLALVSIEELLAPLGTSLVLRAPSRAAET
jgi:transcriptional regulator with XRE-family HTH domain